MNVKDITELVDKIYVIEDEEETWLFVVMEVYGGDILIARCLEVKDND